MTRIRLAAGLLGPAGEWAKTSACRDLLSRLRGERLPPGVAGPVLSADAAQEAVWAIFYPPASALRRGRPPKNRPRPPDAFERARIICRRCPVRSDCLEAALESGDIFGVRGGYSPKELDGMVKLRRDDIDVVGVVS